MGISNNTINVTVTSNAIIVPIRNGSNVVVDYDNNY